jgi:hypothetical protein
MEMKAVPIEMKFMSMEKFLKHGPDSFKRKSDEPVEDIGDIPKEFKEGVEPVLNKLESSAIEVIFKEHGSPELFAKMGEKYCDTLKKMMGQAFKMGMYAGIQMEDGLNKFKKEKDGGK